MIQTIYLIILVYFIIGGIGVIFINRNREPEVARKSLTKFITYFIIINILFFSIVIDSFIFRIIAILIILMGFMELIKLFKESGFELRGFFVISIIVYVVVVTGFYLFSGLDKKVILLSFLIVSIFDSFSQIAGQIWGRHKIFPKISPQKTIEGVIGGVLAAILSALLLQGLANYPVVETIIITCGVIVFAFTGDLAASWYKRKFRVKDYSNLIPGHGGFLDRFDSLMAAGAWVVIYDLLNIN